MQYACTIGVLMSALLRSSLGIHRWTSSSTMSSEFFRLPISSVVAVTPSWGIGNRGTLPWACVGKHIPADVAYFKKVSSLTKDSSKMNAVVMGKDTWNSIPEKFRPLPGRLNIIVSTSLSRSLESHQENVFVVDTFENALQNLSENPQWHEKIERIVVIGGARLFEESFFHPWFDTLHLTQVQEEFVVDTFLTPRTIEALERIDFEPLVVETLQENGVNYRIVEYGISQSRAVNE